jgi:hypothetical protein
MPGANNQQQPLQQQPVQQQQQKQPLQQQAQQPQQPQQQQQQQQKPPSFGSQVMRGAVLPTAIGTGLGALSQVGRAGGNPGLMASTVAGSGVKTLGSLAANSLSQNAPNSKLGAIAGGALATAGDKFEEANRQNALRTGSSSKGFASGLGAGVQGLLEGGLGAIPGGGSLSRGVEPILGALARTISTGDPSHLLTGLGGAAGNVLSSPTLGNDMSQLLTKSKAKDYAGGRWGYNAQKKEQAGKEAGNENQAPAAQGEAPQEGQPQQPAQQPGQGGQPAQAVQEALGEQRQAAPGEPQVIPQEQAPGEAPQEGQLQQQAQQPEQGEQPAQAVQAAPGDQQLPAPEEPQRIPEEQTQGEAPQAAQGEEIQRPDNPLGASLTDVPAPAPMPAARTAQDGIPYEAEDAQDLKKATRPKAPFEGVDLDKIESKRAKETMDMPRSGKTRSDGVPADLERDPSFQRASPEEQHAMIEEQNRQMGNNRSPNLNSYPDIVSHKERRREAIKRSALGHKELEEGIKQGFIKDRWPRIKENAKVYSRVKNEAEQQHSELEKQDKETDVELSKYLEGSKAGDYMRRKEYLEEEIGIVKPIREITAPLLKNINIDRYKNPEIRMSGRSGKRVGDWNDGVSSLRSDLTINNSLLKLGHIIEELPKDKRPVYQTLIDKLQRFYKDKTPRTNQEASQKEIEEVFKGLNDLDRIASNNETKWGAELEKITGEYNAPIGELKAKKEGIARRMNEQEERLREIEQLKGYHDKYQRVKKKFGLKDD